ncbi:hypothetical protein CRG98_038681 [Punica granatum]|uniref:Uncharacterized protein n=1 Tax=Punica granatum TaxID=22663 RepID=A0A2I0IC06_PUNGR|nr:hypothetical protein CRG98_038681 [Punica granatum]
MRLGSVHLPGDARRTHTISLGPEVSKLRLDGHVRGERRSRWSAIFDSWRVGGILLCFRTPLIEAEEIFLGSLEIPFLEGWMLGEIRTLDDHGSPRIQDSFDVSLTIHKCLIIPPSVFESSPCRVFGDYLQAVKLPHHSRREICGGPRMTYEWYSVKIRAPKGRGSRWHPRGSPLKAPRWYFAKNFDPLGNLAFFHAHKGQQLRNDRLRTIKIHNRAH